MKQPTPDPRRVLVVVSAAVFMASLDLFIVNIAFPDIQADLGGSDSALSWVLNAYAIVLAALLVPAGRIADMVGRKRSFLAGLALFAFASALAGLAPSIGALVAARVVQAVGAALLIPTSLALLLSAAPLARRTAYVGAWAAAGGVAAAAGPPIAALLVLLGAVVLTLGVAALTAAIVEGPRWGWGSPPVLGLFGAAVVLLAVFARRTLHHPVPVVEPELLRVRSFAWANAAGLFFFAGFGAMLLGGVLFLTRVWGEEVLTAGLMISPGPLMAALFSVVGARWTDRFGHRAVAVAGGLAFAAGSLWW